MKFFFRCRRTASAWGLVLGLCLAAQAAAQPPTLSVADPQHPAALPNAVLSSSPLSDPALPASLDEAIRRWQAAHRAVGEFPRGHIDLLRWEQGQSPQATAPTGSTVVRLQWPEAWRQVQRQHANRLLGPRANALERLETQNLWLTLERQARQAWVQAITDQGLLRLQHERLHAARTAHALGERMARLGHWSRARFIPVQQTLAQEQAALVNAQWQASQSLEALAEWMGLWQAAEVQGLAQRLPSELPTPPRVSAPAQAEGLALAQRPALQWQREAAAQALQSVDRRQWARWSDELDRALHAAEAQQASGRPPQVPQWPPNALRGDHALDQALAAHTALQRQAAEVRSRVRLAWDQLQATQALDALQHEQLLPLAQAAETETLLRYNGMLQSTWELIDAARARLAIQAEALLARQAHWQAHTDWHTLMAGGDIPAPAGPSVARKGNSNGAPKGH